MAAMHPVLDQTRDLLAATLAGRSPAEVAQHPRGGPARWSARQVVEHLAATWRLTTNGVEERIRKGRPLQTRPTLKQHCMQFAVCNCGHFPKGRKAPPAVLPPPIDPTIALVTGDELIARISATLGAMDRALNRIEPDAGDAPVLTHIVLGPLSVKRWRIFHRVHARHHVGQMQRAIRGL